MGAKVREALVWLLLSAVVGVCAGAGGVVLAACVQLAQRAVAALPGLTWALPLTGLATAALYRALRVAWGISTGTVIGRAAGGTAVPPTLAPAILAGTCLTVTGGGSVGKEAAALQLGGAMGSMVGSLSARIAPLRAAGLRAVRDGSLVRCGMAAAFAALFYAPVAATLFVCEVTRCRPSVRTVASLACSALVGTAAADLFPDGFLWRPFMPHALVSHRLAACVIVAVACAACACAFCATLRVLKGRMWGWPGGAFDSPWAHMALGGLAVVALAHALGIQGFCGTGDALMRAAFAGSAAPADFACKALLTLLTLGIGAKGGEIMPAMAVGACLGCVVGPLVGAEAGPSAALGAMCMFAACTNCPLAALALGIEAFGWAMGGTLALGVALAYALSAPVGLYDSNLPGGYRGLVQHCRAAVMRLLAR